jgi:hypothetical protein
MMSRPRQIQRSDLVSRARSAVRLRGDKKVPIGTHERALLCQAILTMRGPATGQA